MAKTWAIGNPDGQRGIGNLRWTIGNWAMDRCSIAECGNGNLSLPRFRGQVNAFGFLFSHDKMRACGSCGKRVLCVFQGPVGRVLWRPQVRQLPQAGRHAAASVALGASGGGRRACRSNSIGDSVVERRMPARRVVPALDEVEDRRAGPRPACAASRGRAARTRASRRSSRTSRCRSNRRPSPSRAGRAPRGTAGRTRSPCTGSLDPNDGSPPSGRRCAIAMSRAATHEARAQMRRHRPADDAATPDIEHDRQIQRARPTSGCR